MESNNLDVKIYIPAKPGDMYYVYIYDKSTQKIINKFYKGINKDPDPEERLSACEDMQKVKVIPEKVALGLVSSFFDNEYVNALETELVQVEEYFSEDAYKVDAVGESMNDGTLRSLLDGDKFSEGYSKI